MRSTSFFAKRRFLKFTMLGIGGVVAAAAGGVSYLTLTHRYRERYGKLLSLDGHLADVVHTLAEACLPARAGFPTVQQAEVVNRLDEEMFFVSDGISADMKAALYMVEMLPLVQGYTSRFSRLTLPQRRQFLTAASDTQSDTVRAVIFNLAATMRWYYYGHPSTWAVIGYDGPFMNLPEQRGVQRVLYAEWVGKR